MNRSLARHIIYWRKRNWTKTKGHYYRYGQGPHGIKQMIRVDPKMVASLDATTIKIHKNMTITQ